jgi:long-chain acyl-CoA synthetase
MLRSIFSHTRFAEISDKLAHISIGEVPLPLDLAGQAEKMHISVSQGWGICESTAYGIGSPCLGRKKAGSIGIPNIDGEVKIVDTEMGRELSAGKLGEILLRGPYVIKGYWRNPEKTARQLLPDGWLRTGSLGYIDEEGYIFIVGRVNNAF